MYYLYFLPLRILSILPFWLLYLLSDLCFFFLYHILRYRREVVRQNLEKAFPERSAPERKRIEVNYYRHVCDVIVEVIKSMSLDKAGLEKRCRMEPAAIELFRSLHREGKSIAIVSGHCGNWEWSGSAFSLQSPYALMVLYRPIRNRGVNKLMLKIRSRFGNELVAMNDTLRHLVSSKGRVFAAGFISDQSAQPDQALWLRFLNQDTPVFTGPEKIARKFGLPVVFYHIRKIKRGYYSVGASLITEDPASLPENQVTEMHCSLLEKDIIAQPETWLWSHRRWKHSRRG